MAETRGAFAPYRCIPCRGPGDTHDGPVELGGSATTGGQTFLVRIATVTQGSPNAIQRLSPPGGNGEFVAESTPRVRRAQAGRPRGELSKIAWVPPGDLLHPEWVAAGRRLGAIGRCSQWWIGDWIRYGTAKWGEKYAEAARVTGYDVASLRNMAWVASRFDVSLRSDKLTWSHHVLLAPLELDQQRRWLQRAIEQRLSVSDLRLELKANRDDRGGDAGRRASSSGATEKAIVCPHCGHTVHPSE
jgi:hypothetical protein